MQLCQMKEFGAWRTGWVYVSHWGFGDGDGMEMGIHGFLGAGDGRWDLDSMGWEMGGSIFHSVYEIVLDYLHS